MFNNKQSVRSGLKPPKYHTDSRIKFSSSLLFISFAILIQFMVDGFQFAVPTAYRQP